MVKETNRSDAKLMFKPIYRWNGVPSGIRTHELQIRCEPSSLLRYAVRWQFGKGKLKNDTYIFYSLFR